jgi:hypothetical protein
MPFAIEANATRFKGLKNWHGQRGKTKIVTGHYYFDGMQYLPLL